MHASNAMPQPATMIIQSVAAVALAAAAAIAAAQTAPEAAAQPAGGPVKGASYVVDPTHTFVMYEMGHYGTTTNRGRFSTKDGTIKIDGTGRSGKIDITMDIGSINTGVDLLNRHVLSRDFFNVAEFPVARFVASSVKVISIRRSAARGSNTSPLYVSPYAPGSSCTTASRP